MRTFAELLIEYTQRAGISDAELARTTGVQRQTIFRWKEGLVARPRYREDVIRIAAKLRLTAAERDEMLLAAGFPPEAAPLPDAVQPSDAPAPQDVAASAAETTAPEPVQPTASIVAGQDAGLGAAARPAQRLFPNPGVLLGVALVIMLGVALVGGFVAPRFLPAPVTPTPAATPVSTPVVLRPTATPIVVAAGQKMLLVAPFVSYAADDLRFNVAGRIAETVRDEVQQARLRNVHVAVLETPISAHEEARALLTQTGAAAVIWGEYDAGRVRANVTMRNDDADWVNPVDSPAQLALVINDAVPNGGRVLAFYALGRVFREENEHATALKLFQSALALNPSDRDMLASLNFYIGALLPVVEGQTVPVISRAIAAYTAAYALRPDWENIRYNRGTALLGRALLSLEEAADLDAAIADLSAVIDLLPRNPAPLINRGIAYYQRNDEGDAAAAAADFSAALALDADNAMSHYHRALALLRMDGDWVADMQAAADFAPGDPSIANGLCWGYSVSGLPDLALPACEAAVAVDPTGASLDGRAIAYAQLGRHAEAAADLEDYLGWVMRTYPDLYSKYRGPEIETWIAQLREGENPFDAPTLAALRRGE